MALKTSEWVERLKVDKFNVKIEDVDEITTHTGVEVVHLLVQNVRVIVTRPTTGRELINTVRFPGEPSGIKNAFMFICHVTRITKYETIDNILKYIGFWV